MRLPHASLLGGTPPLHALQGAQNSRGEKGPGVEFRILGQFGLFELKSL